MPITTKDQLLAALDAALKGMTESRLDPVIGNPERYKSSDPTFLPPPVGSPPVTMEQMHFCYFGPGANGTFRTLVYLVDGQVAPLADRIAGLIAGARANGASVPGAELVARLPSMEWRKPGYVVFCVDLPGWKFLDRVTDGQRQCLAIYFAEQPTADGSGSTMPNRSFYNARFLPVSVEGQAIEVVVVENHHFDGAADPAAPRLPRPLNHTITDEYKYDIFLTIDIEGSTSGEVLPMVIDPGGKNIGPP